MSFVYTWGYRGSKEGYGWICSEEQVRHPRPTGMIWKGGVLGYRWIGPPTLFWHTMNRMLLGHLYHPSRSTLFDPAPLPHRSGNQIKFFTYLPI